MRRFCVALALLAALWVGPAQAQAPKQAQYVRIKIDLNDYKLDPNGAPPSFSAMPGGPGGFGINPAGGGSPYPPMAGGGGDTTGPGSPYPFQPMPGGSSYPGAGMAGKPAPKESVWVSVYFPIDTQIKTAGNYIQIH